MEYPEWAREFPDTTSETFRANAHKRRNQQGWEECSVLSAMVLPIIAVSSIVVMK